MIYLIYLICPMRERFRGPYSTIFLFHASATFRFTPRQKTGAPVARAGKPVLRPLAILRTLCAIRQDRQINQRTQVDDSYIHISCCASSYRQLHTKAVLARKSDDPSRVTAYVIAFDEGFLSSMLFDTTDPRLARNSTSIFGTSWGRACDTNPKGSRKLRVQTQNVGHTRVRTSRGTVQAIYHSNG